MSAQASPQAMSPAEFRAPSFAALQATATCVRGTAIADLIAVAGSLDPVMGDVDR